MEITLSLLFYLIIFLIVFIVFIKNENFQKFIILCLFVRLIFILINISIFPLPDSRGDAFNWEWNAWFWANLGITRLLNEIITLTHGNSWTYAKMISYIYVFTGRNYLLILLLNLSISLLTMHWLIKIIKELNFNNNQKKIILIFFIFFPGIINYSSVSLREVYIIFMISLIIFYLIKWVNNFDMKYFLILAFLFFINNFLHEGIFTGIIILFLILLFNYLSNLINNFNYKNISIFLFSFSSISVLLYYFHNSIPYLELITSEAQKSFQGIPQCERVPGCENKNLNFFESLMNKTKISHDGDSSYPNYLIPNGQFETILITPLRMLYFYVGPFLIDIKKVTHYYIYLDSLLYTAFLGIIFYNFKKIISNKYFLILLIFLLYFSFIFSFGTSNFGSSYRHRVKFILFFLILTTPFIDIYISRLLEKYKN